MKYKIVLYTSEEGYAAQCPTLPGCWSQGATKEEAVANIKEAVTDYLAALKDMADSEPDVEERAAA